MRARATPKRGAAAAVAIKARGRAKTRRPAAPALSADAAASGKNAPATMLAASGEEKEHTAGSDAESVPAKTTATTETTADAGADTATGSSADIAADTAADTAATTTADTGADASVDGGTGDGASPRGTDEWELPFDGTAARANDDAGTAGSSTAVTVAPNAVALGISSPSASGVGIAAPELVAQALGELPSTGDSGVADAPASSPVSSDHADRIAPDPAAWSALPAQNWLQLAEQRDADKPEGSTEAPVTRGAKRGAGGKGGTRRKRVRRDKGARDDDGATTGSVDGGSSVSAGGPPVSEEEQKRIRRVKNRASVEKCRNKQRIRLESLTREREALAAENSTLRSATEQVRTAMNAILSQVAALSGVNCHMPLP